MVGHVLDLWGMSTTLWLLTAATLAIFAGIMLPLMVAARAQRAVAEAA